MLHKWILILFTFAVLCGQYQAHQTEVKKNIEIEDSVIELNERKSEPSTCVHTIRTKYDVIKFIESLFDPKTMYDMGTYLYRELQINLTSEDLINTRKFLDSMKLHELGKLVTEKTSSAKKYQVNEIFDPEIFRKRGCYQVSKMFYIHITQSRLTYVNNFFSNENEAILKENLQPLSWKEVRRSFIKLRQINTVQFVICCIVIVLGAFVFYFLSWTNKRFCLLLLALALGLSFSHQFCNRQQKENTQIQVYQNEILTQSNEEQCNQVELNEPWYKRLYKKINNIIEPNMYSFYLGVGHSPEQGNFEPEFWNAVNSKQDLLVFIQSLFDPNKYEDKGFFMILNFNINSSREALINARHFLNDPQLHGHRKLLMEKIELARQEWNTPIFSPDSYEDIDSYQVSKTFEIKLYKKELTQVNIFLSSSELKMLSWNEISRCLFNQSGQNKTVQIANYWIWFLLMALAFICIGRKSIMWPCLIIAALVMWFLFSYQACNQQIGLHQKETQTGSLCGQVETNESWPRYFFEGIAWIIEFPVNYVMYGFKASTKEVKDEYDPWRSWKSKSFVDKQSVCDWSRMKPLGNPINKKIDLIVFIQSLFHSKNFINAGSMLYKEITITSTRDELKNARKFLKKMKLHELGELVTVKSEPFNKQTINEMFSPMNFYEVNCYQASKTFFVNITKERLTEVNNFLNNEEQQILLWNEMTRRLINLFQYLVICCIPIFLRVIVLLRRNRKGTWVILTILTLSYLLCYLACNRQKKIEQIISYQQNMQRGDPCELEQSLFVWMKDFIIHSVSIGTIQSPEEACFEHMRQQIYVEAEFRGPLEVLVFNWYIIPIGFIEIILPAIICIYQNPYVRQLALSLVKPLNEFATKWFQRCIEQTVQQRPPPTN